MSRTFAVFLMTVLSLFTTACSDELFDAQCDLVVLNDSTCGVSVFVDGREAFVVKPGADYTLDDVGPGRHIFEAVTAKGDVVARRTVELATGEDVYWTVDQCTGAK